ncbi:M1 family aminopeptidase [Hymenobacter sp. M29]|uniref:M1 family aminopeptidase n=1 Tax=Hymenobacter mellowenesis TaxID=3063995 RepID=A0ABT9A746_9BACT|nr:M1 family aminopeptidase [Hymenobacter sp. M29]MDO7845665.1 M1 family aminopeptidase [Hymenobacter sp. M29]
MPRQLLIFLLGLLGWVPVTRAQPSAQILLRVEPGSKHFWCRYTLRLPAGAAPAPVLLNLNRSFRVLSVRSPRAWQVVTKPYWYAGFQDTLQGITLQYPSGDLRPRQITVTYEGNLTARYATDQVLEFSRNTVWVPFLPYKEDELTKYELEVRVPAGYDVVSTRHPAAHRGGRFRFRGTTAALEPTALISRDFQRLASAPPGPPITVIKAGALLPADTLLLAQATQIVAFYNQTIGRRDTIPRFTVLLPGTNRNAAGLLDNAVDITYADFDVRKRDDRLILAHEISHKWWSYGSISGYEEWLNEGFATYSSLLYLQASGDTTGFRTELAQRLASAAGAPAIIGFDKATHDYHTARRVVYAKGTAVLHALSTRVGNELFVRIMAATAAQKTATTEAFLTTVAQEAGPETQRWLRDQLTR